MAQLMRLPWLGARGYLLEADLVGTMIICFICKVTGVKQDLNFSPKNLLLNLTPESVSPLFVILNLEIIKSEGGRKAEIGY